MLKREEYEQLFFNQQATMEAPLIEQPEEVEAPEEKPEVKQEQKPVEKPKVIKISDPVSQAQKHPYLSGQYNVQPSFSKVAEGSAPYGTKKPLPPTQQKQEEVQLDLSAVKEGAIVTHKTFGEGTVTMLDKAQKHICVRFKVGEKMFIFPDAFKNGFLKV